jgi:hypothetical protein
MILQFNVGTNEQKRQYTLGVDTKDVFGLTQMITKADSLASSHKDRKQLQGIRSHSVVNTP